MYILAVVDYEPNEHIYQLVHQLSLIFVLVIDAQYDSMCKRATCLRNRESITNNKR